VACDTKPAAVVSWTTASATRDFREAKWVSRAAQRDPSEEHKFVVEIQKPGHGFAAVFAEAQFNGRSLPFYLSTNLQVVQPATAATAAGGN
jgi:PhoPQ-activated pathogenicity-related protein